MPFKEKWLMIVTKKIKMPDRRIIFIAIIVTLGFMGCANYFSTGYSPVMKGIAGSHLWHYRPNLTIQDNQVHMIIVTGFLHPRIDHVIWYTDDKIIHAKVESEFKYQWNACIQHLWTDIPIIGQTDYLKMRLLGPHHYKSHLIIFSEKEIRKLEEKK